MFLAILKVLITAIFFISNILLIFEIVKQKSIQNKSFKLELGSYNIFIKLE